MTDSVKIEFPPHDPIASTLSAADDRIVMSEWLPPQEGIVPRIRIGGRWISILWVLPIGAAALVLAIALAQSLRELQSVHAFIKEYPGIAQSAPSVDSGFPWWLQLQHFLNMLFMMFIIRAGFRSWPITRGFIGPGTARPARSGFVSSIRSRRAGFGPRRTIR